MKGVYEHPRQFRNNTNANRLKEAVIKKNYLFSLKTDPKKNKILYELVGYKTKGKDAYNVKVIVSKREHGGLVYDALRYQVANMGDNYKIEIRYYDDNLPTHIKKVKVSKIIWSNELSRCAESKTLNIVTSENWGDYRLTDIVSQYNLAEGVNRKNLCDCCNNSKNLLWYLGVPICTSCNIDPIVKLRYDHIYTSYP